MPQITIMNPSLVESISTTVAPPPPPPPLPRNGGLNHRVNTSMAVIDMSQPSKSMPSTPTHLLSSSSLLSSSLPYSNTHQQQAPPHYYRTSSNTSAKMAHGGGASGGEFHPVSISSPTNTITTSVTTTPTTINSKKFNSYLD